MNDRKLNIKIRKALDSTSLDYNFLPFIIMKLLSQRQIEAEDIEAFRQKYGFEFRDYELYDSIVKKFDDKDESYTSDIKSSINALKNSRTPQVQEIYSHIPDKLFEEESLKEIIEILKEDFPIENLFELAKNANLSKEVYPMIPGIPEMIENILENHEINNFYDPSGEYFPLLNKLNFKNATVYDKSEETYLINLQKMILYDIPFEKVKLENREVIADDSYEKYDTIVSMPPLYDRKTQNKLLKQIDKYPEYRSKSIVSVYLLNLIDHLADDGILITSVTPDLLVRKDSYELRKCLVERNLVDCILDYTLVLPKIELALLIIRKNKPDNDIIFMKEKDGVLVFSNKNAHEHYLNRESIPQFSEVVSKSEIVKNDYNLLPKRYVYLLDYKTRDIQDVMQRQNEFREDIRKLDEEIEDLINEISGL